MRQVVRFRISEFLEYIDPHGSKTPDEIANSVGVNSRTVDHWLADPSKTFGIKKADDYATALGSHIDVIWKNPIKRDPIRKSRKRESQDA